MNSVSCLDKLIASLSKLPGVGRRSAERMAMKLAQDPDGLLKELTAVLKATGESICCCSRCGSITSINEEPCRLCTDQNRDTTTLCIVENPSDIIMIERSGGFHGRYHVLGNKISPMKGTGVKDLRIKSLLTRIEKENFEEVILALNTDVESEATAGFIADLLKGRKVKVTRLAFGLPAGSGIMYSDPVTLARAIKGRTVT